MTKKIILGFFALTLFLSATGYAKKGNDDRKEKDRIAKEDRQREKAEKNRLRTQEEQKRKEQRRCEKKERLKKEKEEQDRIKAQEEKLRQEERARRKAKKREERERQDKMRKEEEVRRESEREKRIQERKETKKRAEQERARKKEEGFFARMFKRDENKKRKAEQDRIKAQEEKLRQEERARRKAKKREERERQDKMRKERGIIDAQESAKRKAARAEKERIRTLSREAKVKRANEQRARYETDLRAEKFAAQEKRVSQMSSWKNVREREVSQDYFDGAYADLYKVPSWPFYMLYTEDGKKDLFRVEVKYDYATTAYNSDGSSQDVTSLVFGEKAIQWQDLSMALRLDKKGIILSGPVTTQAYVDAARQSASVLNVPANPDATGNNIGQAAADGAEDNIRNSAMFPRRVSWNLIKDYLADKQLVFNGTVQEWGTAFNYFRYLKGKDLAFGVEIPFGYKSHRLKVDSNISSHDYVYESINNFSNNVIDNIVNAATNEATSRGANATVANATANSRNQATTINHSDVYAVNSAATASNVLDHSMIPETLNYLLAPKGLSYLPKMSVIGIGDVATFLNYYVTTKYLERFVIGARVSWPTAKDAVTHKVWAPQLGNGFTKISAYASLMFNKQGKNFNPYSFFQASFNWPGHKKTRVPQIINFDGKIKGNAQAINDLDYYTKVDNGSVDGQQVNAYLQDLVSFGSRIDYTQKRAYTEYDTQIPAFADNVKSVRIQPGPEVEMRLGNMFEEFIFRRAFFDIYYNFMAKWKDYIGGNLPRDIWAVDVLKDNTYKLEHKIGGEFSYQFDAQARFHIGADWVFAGRNVAKNLEIRGNMDIAF